MIPQRPTESAYADAPELRGFLAADVETTADLQGENTADLTPAPAPEDETLDATDSAALRKVAMTLTVDSDSRPANDARTADVPAIDDRPRAPLPTQRGLGFFAFAACALIAILAATQQPTESSSPRTQVVLAAKPPAGEMQPGRSGVGAVSADSRKMRKPAETRATQSAGPKRRSAGSGASLGLLSFESRSFATSEQAIAAVFIVERTQMVRGSALVHWAALSGSADAGIDFSDASGTVRFADGQRQIAIYVPLRNDLLKEEDETFKVCLRSPRQARIGGRSCAEATIRDDDKIAPT